MVSWNSSNGILKPIDTLAGELKDHRKRQNIVEKCGRLWDQILADVDYRFPCFFAY